MNYLKLKQKIYEAIERNPLDRSAYEEMFAVCREYEKIDFQTAHAWNHELRNHISRGLRMTVSCQKFDEAREFDDLMFRSLLFGAQHFFDDYLQAVEYGKPLDKKFYQPRRHYLRRYVDAYQEILDGKLDFLSISMPKRAGKSQLGINFTNMLSGKYPDRATLMEGTGDDLVKSFYLGCLEYLTLPSDYHFYDIFPESKLVQTNADTKIINLLHKSRFPTVMCRSIDARQVGLSEATNLLYLDDCVEGREEAKNRQRLDDKWEVISGDIIGRAIEGTPIVICGTRYSLYDPMIHYEDAKGEVHDTIITNVTFGMNLSTSIAGKGETTQKQKYSQGGGLTKQQATILEKLRENLDKAMTAKEQAQLELNRLLSNSLGLNIVTIPQDDGTQVYYFCDGETLESSNIIYTFKANGFAWTKSWNDGNPVWKYGFSKDGNAIYNMLAAYKISTEYLDAECVTAEKLSAEYKQSVTTEMEETVDEKLTDYSTTEETKTLIANTGGTIRTEVAESVKTVTDTTNAKIDDRLAQAKDYTDSVHQEITTEYSTKLEETSKGFNMSVNSLTDRITEQGNEVNSYREQFQTYFGFSEDGVEIGKKVNGEKQQYSINIDNERMGFLQDGSEVAFIQYNKLHINAVEAMDRLSVGAAADGGYFDFISTEYGMGVKWRAVEKTDNASIVSVMKIPRRASKYVPVVDEDNIFQMEGVNEE